MKRLDLSHVTRANNFLSRSAKMICHIKIHKNEQFFLPDLSYNSQIRTNAINTTVDMNDIQTYVIFNGEMVIFSVMVISIDKYASANSNICANNNII